MKSQLFFVYLAVASTTLKLPDEINENKELEYVSKDKINFILKRTR